MTVPKLSSMNFLATCIIDLVDWKFSILRADGLTEQMCSSAIFDANLCAFSLPETGETITFDGAFIALHGHPGETGHLQAYLDMVRLPYSGSTLFTTTIAMHKFACKSLLRDASNIKSPKHLLLTVRRQPI